MTVDTGSNITDLLQRQVNSHPERPLYSRRTNGIWTDVSAREFHRDVTAVAKGLIGSGVAGGDRVGLMAHTSYEWTLVDFAIWYAGAVTVPVYETSSAEQLSWIVGDSGTTSLFTESRANMDVLAAAYPDDDGPARVWCFEDGGLDVVREAGRSVDDDTLEERRRAAGLESLATIIYTSGTTGRPKGCELTHGNFVLLSESAIDKIPEVFAEDARTLMFLPLAHVFARYIQVLCVAAGTTMGHTSDLKDVTRDLGSFQPTFVLAVPRVFEKVFNSAEQSATADKKGGIFARAADVAVKYSESLDTGKPSLGLKLQHTVFDKLVYSKLRKALGGQVTHAVSGGGPLGEYLGHFYRGIGLIVMEGYGLTETTAPLTVNLPSNSKIGTVGPPLPGCAVRIAPDGEVLAKGICVFRGYWHNKAATNEAFSGGWFHTGDLGSIDEDGYLTIVGRKKEILVTAGGKNVAPAPLEDRLRRNILVGQAVVVGDQRKFIAALITLDSEMLPTWLKNNGLGEMSLPEAADNPAVLDEIQRAVDDANQSVSRAESIRKFAILPIELTEESGHLSAKQSVKRHVVNRDFAEQIDDLYR
ncbi:AMP-dependent synthetase/ligase [Spelaeicoccus albus]|nr:AMP-dependent synthetase/ligase [Spelaeicoccus albus]